MYTTPGTTPTPRHPGETTSERYLRQIRNAAVIIAVIVVIAAIVTLVGSVIQGVELSHMVNNLNDVLNNGTSSSGF